MPGITVTGQRRALYAALGRIKKILFFSRESDELVTTTGGKFGNLSARLVPYDLFISHLEAAQIQVFVSFDFDSATPPSISYNETDPVIFIPMEGNGGITTKWVQDAIIPMINLDNGTRHAFHKSSDCVDVFGQPQPGYLDRVMDIEHVSSMMIKTDRGGGIFSTEERCCYAFDGGNALLGKDSKNDYLLIGPTTFCRTPDAILATKFFIDPKRIFHFVPIEQNGGSNLQTLLFHLDLYTTILGPVDAAAYAGTEVLLIGKAMGTPELSDTINTAITLAFDELKQKSGIQFSHVEFPMIVVGDDPKTALLLSFNNCHVENFTDTTGHHVRLYLPEYEETVESFVDNTVKNAISFTGIEDMIRMYVHAVEASFYLSGREKSFTQGDKAVLTGYARWLFHNGKKAFKRDLKENLHGLIIKAKAEIEQKRTQLGIEKPVYIEYDYMALSTERKGSLHCMSLVIERGEPDESSH